MMLRRIMVLGGDGFCGWPASLHLLQKGHSVLIVDNLVRRKLDESIGPGSLTPINTPAERLTAATSLFAGKLDFVQIDVALEYDKFLATVQKFKPDTIIHFAEQRSAPYSMKTSENRRYTVDNNNRVTHNVLCAIVDSRIDIHLVHLGTMGVYGYNNIGVKIPEGYLDIKVANSDGGESACKILYPADPGSIYHMTKAQDQLLFYFYNKNYGIKITDLHQGVVWGTNTELTLSNDRLINRFDYDGDYGTVLNRFLMQSALNYPLTVNGSGGQQRAFIHIRDSVVCVGLAVENPPLDRSEVRIFNQATEVYSVLSLAKLVSDLTGCSYQHVDNPRLEMEGNVLNVEASALLALGLTPTLLKDGLLMEVYETASKYIDRVDVSKIPCVSNWRV